MPKIIENVREQLLIEAKKQIMENGYTKTTIRSVAKACGLAVGTVYNYYSSKDMLIASFMAEDWKHCLEQIQKHASDSSDVVIKSICENISGFVKIYNTLFCDGDAVKVYADAFSLRHKQLRDQLAGCVRPLCEMSAVKDKDFLAEWIAESLLAWTVAGKSFDEQYDIIKQIIK